MKFNASMQPISRADRFRFPAEWEPHAATWLAWPHFRGDWPGKFEPIPWVYAEIIRHLARHERVELIVNHAESEKRAKKLLDRANALSENVRFHRWPTDRATRVAPSLLQLGALASSARPDGRGRPSPR
jgi:agmatine/peptidylarginine deiminase